jgi:hypothetical protein
VDCVRDGRVRNKAGQVLSFNASDYSGVANASFTRPTGISKSNLGLAWVVGYYILTTSNTTHSFAVQVDTIGPKPAIVANTWLNFDIQAAASGLSQALMAPMAAMLLGSSVSIL